MITLSPREEFDYILEEDRGSEKPTVFRLAPLDLFEAIAIEDKLGEKLGSGGYAAGTFNYRVCKAGWKGVTNLMGPDGKPVVFVTDKDGKVDDSLIGKLSSQYRAELANAIWQVSRVTEADAKN